METFLSERAKGIDTSALAEFFAKAAEMEHKGEPIIHLHVGEPDFDTPNHIKEAAVRAMKEGFTHYSSPAGLLELREAVSEKLGLENGIDVDPKREVTITQGGFSALFYTFQALLNPGDEVIIPDPSLPEYLGDVALAGGVVISLPLREENDFRVDPEELRGKVGKRTKIILLNSPENPTGSVLDKRDLEAIAEIARENNLFVVSDEVYEKIVYDGLKCLSMASFPEMKERTITINSFSKAYAMTGWRIGYMAANKDIISKIQQISEHATLCPNIITQKAAIAALKGPQDCVRKMVEEFQERRDIIVDGLNRINGFSCRSPSGAFYAFAKIKSFGMPSTILADLLLREARVATISGAGFGTMGEGYMRFSYANSKGNVKEALARIEAVTEKMWGGTKKE